MSTERFTVRVTKDSHIFSCGHFITFAGKQFERLHGHNYRTAVEVDGSLDENWYVFDFIALRDRLQAIVHELDHHMLLATKNPYVSVEEMGTSVRVRFERKEWVFPREDCILLPIENTTAELLAKYIAGRLLADLKKHHGYTPAVMRVEVDENVGQTAVYEWRG
jgi:6-pyruvoyltetrahydropterin/6-carboxytetrahydropterin synthase